jgi:hypothetical protein
MQTLPRHVNPFALMIDPQAVIAQIEGSGRLERLQRRVCRPLDKPLLGGQVDTDDDATGASTDGATAARDSDFLAAAAETPRAAD